MRAAMANAEVGDDVWGEDPTVAQLERETAELLGCAAALFLPSGTMANQAAIHVHCRPGDELICDEHSHLYCFEAGSVARLSGTQARTINTEDGFPTPAQVRLAVRKDDIHHPHSRLLVLENTHNMAGGRILPPARLAELVATCRELGLLVHCDGARLLNAAVALAVPARELTVGLDSVTLCLSKGLGAPVGSMLAGSAPFIAAAKRVRKAFGGAMRQAGVLAAAGLLALREGPQHLATDHARSQELARGLAALPWCRIEVRAVQTNLVMVELPTADPTAVLAHLRANNVLAASTAPGRSGLPRLRFVLHRDVPKDGVARCLAACQSFRA